MNKKFVFLTLAFCACTSAEGKPVPKEKQVDTGEPVHVVVVTHEDLVAGAIPQTRILMHLDSSEYTRMIVFIREHGKDIDNNDSEFHFPDSAGNTVRAVVNFKPDKGLRKYTRGMEIKVTVADPSGKTLFSYMIIEKFEVEYSCACPIDSSDEEKTKFDAEIIESVRRLLSKSNESNGSMIASKRP